MACPRNVGIDPALNGDIGNDDDGIGLVIDAIPYLALHGELAVHGVGLHLDLNHEF